MLKLQLLDLNNVIILIVYFM